MVDGAGSADAPVHTVGGFDRAARAWVLASFGIGGTLAGVLIPWLAGVAADLPWVPFQGPLQLLGSFDDPWLVWGRPAIAALLGLAGAAWVIADAPVLLISRQDIRVRRRGEVTRVIARDKVDGVYRERGTVIILSATGRELFRDDVEGSVEAIRDAFLDCAYPWEGTPGPPRDDAAG